ncbi:MAG: GNAT family N-acetyltransferase [Anaerolineae bacterium]|nr:GNAT family N-acetyltransferase [Anaerolineae bacterium]MDQ7034615.1 GNAT family N-acetyltransferase [Anaerolineae bacterium]
MMSDMVVRGIRESELEPAATLVADVFSQGDSRVRRWMMDNYLTHLPRRPGMKIEYFRAAFVGRKIVAFARLMEFMLHYGQAKLLVAGIGSVCTHPDYRGQGYASAVIQDILTYSAEQGMHMALLNGIPNYYEQFGFMPVWANYTLEALTSDARKLSQSLQLRAAAIDDMPQMARLYNQHWGGRVTFSRDAALWRWRMAADNEESIVALDNTGQIQGYLWHRQGETSARTEVIANTRQAIQTLLAYEGQRFHHAGTEKLVWTVPPDDVIIPYAQTMLPITLNAHYSPTGGWMGRLVDPSAIVHRLLPEIVTQARSLSAKFNPDKLYLQVDSDGVKIGLQDNQNSYCHLSLRDFVQVLFGSLRPHTLAIRHNLSHDSIALLELLFPPRIAALAPWDWF